MPYRCAGCGESLEDWHPKCPVCGLRGLILADDGSDGLEGPTRGRFLESIHADAQRYLPTGIDALDQVLGGGFVVGGVYFLGGPPGRGKSTLLLQCLAGLAAHVGGPSLYAACEEPAGRIKSRALARVTIPRRRVLILPQPTLEEIGRELDARPRMVAIVIDTLHELTTEAPVGARGRLVYCARQLVTWAQDRKLVLVLLAHMNRKGTIAGSLTAEHLVDVVLHLTGQRRSPRRLLTADKNRFGGTDLAAEFRMTGQGLVNGRVLEPEGEEAAAPAPA